MEFGKHIQEVDEEWVQLMMRARDMGITVEEIRKFIGQQPKRIKYYHLKGHFHLYRRGLRACIGTSRDRVVLLNKG
ncbi:anti-repressor SinI family protein [Bacillus fonticola]|uniref:anti-repressor SinI family protein n=1 Tax=Bacillus fonticola TaxID=2728853 RepID=UPI0014764106|nr:anti-repressor SinI family protein [Bacillus fonticola]